MDLPYHVVVQTAPNEFRLVYLSTLGSSASNTPDAVTWGVFDTIQYAVAARNALNLDN